MYVHFDKKCDELGALLEEMTSLPHQEGCDTKRGVNIHR